MKDRLEHFATERLLLRGLRSDDVEGWYRIWSDPKVRWWGEPDADRDVSQEGLSRLMDRLANLPAGFGWWAVIERVSERMVGVVALQPLSSAKEHIEIGYHFMSAVWGRGYATEAARVVLHHGRATLGLEIIVAAIHPDNHPSQGVARRIGLEAGEPIIHAGLPHVLWRTP